MTMQDSHHNDKPRSPRLWAGMVLLICGVAHAQVNNSPLVYIQTIGVPTWTNTGSNQANSDIFGFNPQTHILYMADRVNHSITAIDTMENAVVGVMPVPGNPSTNGVLIAPDLQQMVVTDGKTNVFVYDLRLPGAGPDVYNLPNVGGNTDALDYDPLNHTVYVINGTAPYYETGIDLVNKKVSTQLQLPGAPELMRWNPVDGTIAQVITNGDAGPLVVIYDPVQNQIKATYATPNCVGHGIEIDAVTNTALVGCGPGAQILMNLRDGTVLKTFPEVNTSDLIGYNPNTRRFYTGSSGNTSTLSGCPADSGKLIPVVGVFDAKGSADAGFGRSIGVQCAGRNAKGPGFDPLQNFIYVSIRQYPVDPNDPNTGQSGVMVFWDPSGPTQPPTTQTQASLLAYSAGGPTGGVQMTLKGRVIRAEALLQAVTGTVALLNITTTVGNEQVSCAVNPSGTTHCDGNLLGDPLIGGSVLLGVDGVPVAQGTITGS